MKKTTQVCYILCIFVTVFTACKNDKQGAATGEAAKFTLARIDSVVKNTNQHIAYPVFTGENSDLLNQAVVRMISSDSANTVKSVRQAFNALNIFDLYAEDLKGFDDKESIESMGYSQYDSVVVLRNTPKIIVLSNSNEIYTGGAHGSHGVVFENINPATGKSYKLADFFKPNFETELTKMGEKCFKEQFLPEIDMKATDPLSEENGFWFDKNQKDEGVDNIFYLSENFGISEKGFDFVYASYEVGPYAIGLPSFTIPFSQLKSLLKDEWANEFSK